MLFRPRQPRTGTPPTRPGPDALAGRVFGTLFADFDLVTIDGTHIAVPKGAPCSAGRSLGEIVRQISQHAFPASPDHAEQPPGMQQPERSFPSSRLSCLRWALEEFNLNPLSD